MQLFKLISNEAKYGLFRIYSHVVHFCHLKHVKAIIFICHFSKLFHYSSTFIPIHRCFDNLSILQLDLLTLWLFILCDLPYQIVMSLLLFYVFGANSIEM